MGLLGHNSPTNLSARAVLPPRRDGRGPGPVIPILQLRDTDDSESQALTVFIAPATDPLALPVHGPCIAIVQWGTGAAGVAAEIDIAKGTSLQISASYVSISGRNDGTLPVSPTATLDPAPGPQTVIAMVGGYGGRVALGRATRTFYFAGLAPGATVLAPVPNFAKSVVISRAPLTTSIAVDLRDNLITPPAAPGDIGVPGNIRATFAFADVHAPVLDLPSLVATVEVRNTGPTPIAFLQLAFELCV